MKNKLATFVQSTGLSDSAWQEYVRLELAAQITLLFPNTAKKMQPTFLRYYEKTWKRFTRLESGVSLSTNIKHERELRTVLEVLRNQPRRPDIAERVKQTISDLVTIGDWFEFLICAAEATKYDPQLRQNFLVTFKKHEAEIVDSLHHQRNFFKLGSDDNLRNYTRMLEGYAVLKAAAVKVSELGEITLLSKRRAGQEVPLPVRSET